MTSELGVSSSNQCSPVATYGPVIAFSDKNDSITPAEIAASSYHLQMVSFVDGDLQQVSEGFPRQVNDTVCLKCVKSDKINTPLLSGCGVSYHTHFPSGSMRVGVEATTDAFKTITIGFNTTDGSQAFSGYGDVTNNSQHCAMFLFSKRRQSKPHFTYLEYANQEHCRRLLSLSRDATGAVWELCKGTVWAASVTCNQSRIDARSLTSTLQAYRSMQLERNIQMTPFDDRTQRFQKLREDDVYRAALSALVMDDYNKSGEYYVYSECGFYNVFWIAPLICSIVLITVLRIVSLCVSRKYRHVTVPFNSFSWYQEAVKNQTPHRTETGNSPEKRRCRLLFGYPQHEMVLIGDGPSTRIRIDVRDDTEIFEDVGAGPSSSVYDVSVAMREFQNRENEAVRVQEQMVMEPRYRLEVDETSYC